MHHGQRQSDYRQIGRAAWLVACVVAFVVLLTSHAFAQPRPGPRPGPRTTDDAQPGPRTGPRTGPRVGPRTSDNNANELAGKPIPKELLQPVEPWEPWNPLGASGDGVYERIPSVHRSLPREVVPVPDRWRIGWPAWDRYGRMSPDDPVLMNKDVGDSPYTQGHFLNPYDRNLLKADYPLTQTPGGDDIFLNINVISDTVFNYRKLPTPSGVSATNSNAFDIFGDGKQRFVTQSVFLPIEVFQGYTAFRPVDWLVRVTPAYNYNYIDLQESNNVNIDVRKDDERRDEFATLQEAFFEYHLGDTSHNFDIAALRVGRQLLVTDFRGFIYNDVSDGLRLFGNLASNRIQYNVAYFWRPDKDTNSELTEFNWRDQQIFVANLYVQDFVWLGYTTQFSFHWNHDQSDEEYDNNGFLVVPELSGDVRSRDIDTYYLGWTGDGHIGRININHAFYYVFGEDEHNPLAGREVDVSAFMGAVEVSIDYDWFRPKLHFIYASGDDDPEDGTATGFDGIYDNPFFAGGPGSFYQGQSFRLFGVALHSTRSFFNDLAATKVEGQANHVNPGTILVGGGFDAELTPKWRASLNINSIWFAETEPLELFLAQRDIDNHVGWEINLSTQYRPFLNNNVILTAGGSVFFPGDGYDQIYEGDTALYQGFIALTLTY